MRAGGVRGATAQPPPERPSRAAGRRLDVLTLLREAGRPLPVAELARRLALHPNTVRFHLDALLDSGLVRRVDAERRTPGRPALLFSAVAGMDPGGPRRYRQLAGALAGALDGVPDAPARALQAGREWGRAAARPDDDPTGHDEPNSHDEPGSAVHRLLSLLDDLDFDPVLLTGAPDDVRIGLRRCPFLEVAAGRSPVVCPVHLGLMQGAMRAWASSTTVHRLDPFAQPDLCVAHLGPSDGPTPQAVAGDSSPTGTSPVSRLPGPGRGHAQASSYAHDGG